MIMCQLGAKSSSVIIISGTEQRTAMGSSRQLRRDERFGSRYFATLVACDSLRGGGGGGHKHFGHLERSHLLSSCGIVYKVIRWTLCEFKRDLLHFLDIYSDIIS